MTYRKGSSRSLSSTAFEKILTIQRYWVGVISLPLSNAHRGLDILEQRPKTPTLKLRAIAYLKDTTRSFDYTLSVMKSLENQIRQEVTKLGGNPILEALLDKVRQ
jgi:hypothetical protein